MDEFSAGDIIIGFEKGDEERVYDTHRERLWSGISCRLDSVGCEGGCKNVLDGIGGLGL